MPDLTRLHTGVEGTNKCRLAVWRPRGERDPARSHPTQSRFLALHQILNRIEPLGQPPAHPPQLEAMTASLAAS
ncbi:MAG: hypothetical protein M5U12_15080 [Verrucomicrobia bacterium]|nr:hypothetical protein [Verrucomicrobiota bacterium]